MLKYVVSQQFLLKFVKKQKISNLKVFLALKDTLD